MLKINVEYSGMTQRKGHGEGEEYSAVLWVSRRRTARKSQVKLASGMFPGLIKLQRDSRYLNTAIISTSEMQNVLTFVAR